MDRDKIIEKLKDIKDPAQRDMIIWALAGKEKKEQEVSKERPAAVEPSKATSSTTPKQPQKFPGFPGDARKLVGYVVPGMFIFFGLVNIVQALVHYHITGQLEDAVPKLIIGGLFILFGIFSIFKAKKQVQSGDANHKEA